MYYVNRCFFLRQSKLKNSVQPNFLIKNIVVNKIFSKFFGKIIKIFTFVEPKNKCTNKNA